MNDLMITVNGEEVDAFKQFGIKMGDNFIDTLMQPSAVKEYISNDSRLENGIRVNISPCKIASRSVTLTFVVTDLNGVDMITNLRNFYNALYEIKIAIRMPKVEESVYYNLLYTGKSISYGATIDRRTSKLSVNFDEPDPTSRAKNSQ